MPQSTLYVTGFTRDTKAADLAPDFEKFGELVRLDIPPPRSDDGQKFAFVEYKNTEDCEKALELNGQTLPFSFKDGLTVQIARSDPFSSRRGFRGGFGSRGGYQGRGGYGYPSAYPPVRGGRGGYGYQNYGYERGGYGPYPSRGGRDSGYGGRGSSCSSHESGYGGRDVVYGSGYSGGHGGHGGHGGRGGAGYGGAAPYRDNYGYRGDHDEYRGSAAPNEREQSSYEPRDRYYGSGSGRRAPERAYGSGERNGFDEIHDSRDLPDSRGASSGEHEEYGRGRYSRSNSPKREKSRSRSPSR